MQALCTELAHDWAHGRFARVARQLERNGKRRERLRDGVMLSTLAITLIVIGSIVAVGILIYLLWPTISPMLRKPAKVPLTAGLARGSDNTSAQAGGELPPLFAPV